MHSALLLLIRFCLRQLVALLVIALILAGGALLLEQGRQWRASHADLATLSSASAAVADYRASLVAAAERQAALAQQASLGQLDARIGVLEAQLRAGQGEGGAALLFGAGIAEYSRHQLDLAMARQQLAYLHQLRAFVVASASRDQARQELRRLHAAHVAAYAAYVRLKAKKDATAPLDRAWMDYGWQLGDGLSRLQAQLTQAALASEQARRAYDGQARVLAGLDRLATLAGGQRPALLIDGAALDAATGALVRQLAQARAQLASNWLGRLGQPLLAVLPLALLVLLSSFASHLLVKLLFYFVLAPAAARRRPIRLEAAPKAPQRVQASASAVSHDLWLRPGEELLLLPDYLQSVSVRARKDTKYLLDWHYPWTSLIAGMVLLTRVRPAGAGERVVVSSNADPLSEVALIAIPAGAAMVFQPRGLAGVLYPGAAPLRIERRWQLGSAHAWLTLQLRYLIFRGPVTLVVKGARGVRVEAAGLADHTGQAQHARLISQAATLGFAAHLAYSTVRSATFLPYYMNQAALLDDQFDGDGQFVYAETPRAAPVGLLGRGLEGVIDAVLKVFGI